VQHRLLEQAGDIYQWIEEGAHLYICGDMKKMAVDVQNALSTILRQEGGYNSDEAQEYLNRMEQEKRLQLDVY
jgi:sulfite reductase (NADPH) flavoprotein alpha-component